MRWRSSILTILWPFLSVMLLASCGDFQDPASGSQGTTLSQPSASQAPRQQIDGSESRLTPASAANAVDPASLPARTGTAPPPSETFGAGPRGDTLASESEAGQVSPPSLSETTQTTQLSTGGGDNRPQTKSVTLAWDPSPSGDAAGYKVYITMVSTSVQYAFDAGPETQFQIDLPIGKSYYFTVTGYNAAGEGPPAIYFRFDLL